MFWDCVCVFVCVGLCMHVLVCSSTNAFASGWNYSKATFPAASAEGKIGMASPFGLRQGSVSRGCQC